METLDDDQIADDAHRYGDPVGQARTDALPCEPVEVAFEGAERAYGDCLVGTVDVLDVHVSGVVAEDEQRDEKEQADEETGF